MKPGLFACAVGVATWFFLLGARAVPCPDGQTLEVTSTADAQDLSDTLNCTGGGAFDVIWYGSVRINSVFEVTDGISLTVTGSGLSSSMSPDGDTSTATIIGLTTASETGVFSVSGASTLTLDNLLLRGAYSDSQNNGSAGVIKAQGSYGGIPTVNVFDCHFMENYGYFAGAISAHDSAVVNIYGTTSFTGNMGVYAGAILTMSDSQLNLYEASTFYNNTGRFGGALLLSGGETSIGGNTYFTSNTADTYYGGAIYADNATVSIEGAVFSHNLAASAGGALMLLDGETSIGGNATFNSNSADTYGGAIYALRTNIRIEGAVFSNNFGARGGGAISASDGTSLRIDGVSFSNNAAGRNGGAMLAQDSTLDITGGTTFTNNTASGSGGGLDSTDCEIVSITGSVSFSGNVAPITGGAISMDSAGYFSIDDATFARNEGGSGGAISAVATPAAVALNISRCTFEDNSGTDGGALYVINNGETGAYIQGSCFRENNAAASGGAIYHTGTLNVDDTQFVAKKAYIEGMAIAALGTVYVGSENASFERNALYCPLGEYGYDKELTEDLDTCRAEVVCTGCSTGCDNVLYGLSFAPDSTVPAVDCKSLPVGTVASSAGTTVSTIELAEGHYRVSNESDVVLECYRNDSCHGGLDAGSYCALRYKGPYCAVCADGYGTGSAYSCHECSGKNMKSAVALLVVATILLLGVVVVVLSNLLAMVPVDGSNGEEQEGARGLMMFKLSYLHIFLVKLFPLTSIKIIVVVWQIITQFAAIAGAVYPDEYQRFLSILSPINMDISIISSISCLADINFYHRLLLSTTMPLMVFAVLAGTYAIAKKRNRRSETAVRVVEHKHLSAALFVMFFVYSSVSFTVFQTFVCDILDDGVGYLRADYSLTCWSDEYTRYAVYASVMVVVYPIGIPAAFTWWLARNRHDLSKPGRETVARLQPFSGIWAAYRPSHFYYEVVECGRRIALTGIAAFVLPGSAAQIAVVLLLAVVFSFVSESMQPFQDKLEMRLYRWGNGVVLGSMYVALLRKSKVSGDSATAHSAFAGVLIAGNVFMVVAVLVQSALLAKAWHASNEIVEMNDPFGRHIRTSSVSCIQPVGDAEETDMEILDAQMETT